MQRKIMWKFRHCRPNYFRGLTSRLSSLPCSAWHSQSCWLPGPTATSDFERVSHCSFPPLKRFILSQQTALKKQQIKKQCASADCRWNYYFFSFAQSIQLKLSLLKAAEIGWHSEQSTKFTYCSKGKQPPCRVQKQHPSVYLYEHR